MNNLENIIADILHLSNDDIKISSQIVDIPEWDSLAHITIISAIENRYKIKFSTKEIIQIKSVKDLKFLIEKKYIQ